MSYEGYEQVICENGHYHEFDCLDASTSFYEQWVCDDRIDGKQCNGKAKAFNSVDDTNCDSHGYRKRIEITPEISKECDMGHKHSVSAATFKLSDNIYYRETKLIPDGGHETIWHLCEHQ